MRFGYGEYMARALELAGLTRKVNMEAYEPWDPYRVSSASGSESGSSTAGGVGVPEEQRGEQG